MSLLKQYMDEAAKWKGIVKGVHGALADIGTVQVPALDANLYDTIMSIRAKDAELIQQLVDLAFHDSECNVYVCGKCDCLYSIAIKRAAASGFKPSGK